MTVKRLIQILLDYPRDTEVVLSMRYHDSGEYRFTNDVNVADYEDGSIGIYGAEKEDK